MGQKIVHQPEKIIVVDDPLLKQYSKEERIRHEYVEYRKDPD